MALTLVLNVMTELLTDGWHDKLTVMFKSLVLAICSALVTSVVYIDFAIECCQRIRPCVSNDQAHLVLDLQCNHGASTVCQVSPEIIEQGLWHVNAMFMV